MGTNDSLDIDQTGLDFIARQEGNVLHPYQDICGLWTIGVGHLIVPGDSFSCLSNAEVQKMLRTNHVVQKPNPYAGRLITNDESLDILRRDVQQCVAAIKKNISTPLNQNMFNALCSFLFNLGTGWIAKGGVKTALDRGDYQGACIAMLQFSKAKVNGVVKTIPGLLGRRQAEVAFFCYPVELPVQDPLADIDASDRDTKLASIGYESDRLTCQEAGDCHDLDEGSAA